MSHSNNNVSYWVFSELLCFIICIKYKIVVMGWWEERSKFNVFLCIRFWRLLEIRKWITSALILRAQSFRYVEGQINFLKCPSDVPTLNKKFIFKMYIIIPCSYYNNVHLFLCFYFLRFWKPYLGKWSILVRSVLKLSMLESFLKAQKMTSRITLIQWGTKNTKRLVAICFSWTLKKNEDEKSLFVLIVNMILFFVLNNTVNLYEYYESFLYRQYPYLVIND